MKIVRVSPDRLDAPRRTSRGGRGRSSAGSEQVQQDERKADLDKSVDGTDDDAEDRLGPGGAN